MFRAIFSLIIRSILTVFIASGIIHVRRCRLISRQRHTKKYQKLYIQLRCSWWWAKKYRSKHVE